MKKATKLLCLVLTLATVVTGVLVFAGAEDSALAGGVLVDFDGLPTGALETGKGIDMDTSKAGVKYEVTADPQVSENKYLKFTQGSADPCITPNAYVNFKSLSATSYSYSMDLKKDASFDSVPAYQFRLRTKGVAGDNTGNRSEYVLFSLSDKGEVVFQTSTGIFLQEEVFITVGVSVDFGVNQQYATVTGYIEGVPVQTWKIDAQGTGAYKANSALKDWTAMKTADTFTLNTWIPSPGAGKNPGMLLDNVRSYTGVFTQYGNYANLHLNGGALTGSFTGLYQYGKITALPAQATRSDKATFAGWYDNPEFDGEAVTAIPSDASGELDFYAKWVDEEGNLIEGHLMQYDLNGTGTLPSSGYDVSVDAGTTSVTLPAVADTTNRRFLGWCTDAACEGTVYNGTYEAPDGIFAGITFYAKWIIGMEADMSQKVPFPQWLDEDNPVGGDAKVGIHFTTQDGYILINKEKVEGMTDGQISATGLSVTAEGILTVEISLSAVPGQPVVGMALHTRGGDTTILNVENGTGKLTVGGMEVGVLDEQETLITLVINFTTGTMDAYLDGVQYLDGYAYKNSTTVSNFNSLRLYFSSGNVGQLRIHQFACANGEYLTYTTPTGDSINQVTLTDSQGNQVVWVEEADYTLPEGTWIDAAGAVVSGDVRLTGNDTFRLVDVLLKEGASVRTKAPSGLRFESALDSAVYDALIKAGYTVEFGTYIFPADQYADGIPEGAVFSVFTDVSSLTLNEETGYYTYYTSLIDILDQNYARAFGAVSYLKATLDGQTIRFVTEYDQAVHARSVYQVACSVAAAGELADMTEEQQAAVNGYLNAVVEIKLTDPTDLKGAEIITPDHYTSPYEYVYVMDGQLLLYGSAEKLCSVILNGDVYTAGWDTSDPACVRIPIPQS